MKQLTSFLTAFAMLFCVGSAKAQIVINEVMQSNVTTLFVEQDFPDSWIELYNDSDEPFLLNGYRIGVKEKIEKAYYFPGGTTVPAKGHLLIYCDKVGYGLHTDFRVDSGKGSVILFAPNGKIVDRIDLKKMPAPDVAYGRKTDGSEEMGYMRNPTPGASNKGGIAKKVMPQPVFSCKGGIYSNQQTVEISFPEGEEIPSSAMLCVAIGGREPKITDCVENPYTLTIDKTTVVKAKIISPGDVDQWSVTHSYIFHDRDVTLPVLSLSTEPAYLYDDQIGILVEGTYDPDKYNYNYDWRRPVNIEYFDVNSDSSEAVINQLGETAVKGHSSRYFPQKSLKIYANKRFGTKRFDYPFWPAKPDVHAEVCSFEIKNGGSDCERARLRDEFASTLFGRNIENIDYSEYSPVIVYINGEYVGSMNLRERTQEDYVAANYDGLEEIGMIENWTEIVEGSYDNVMEWKQIIENPDEMEYEKMSAFMDMENFINHFILHIFEANDDFPRYNIMMWRDESDPENPGLWRWVIKDVDFICGREESVTYTFDYFEKLFEIGPDDWSNNGEYGKSVFRTLMTMPEFRNMFVDRMLVYGGDFLQPTNAIGHFNALAEEAKEELLVTKSMYFGMAWEPQCEMIRKWHDGRRTAVILDQLNERYNLGSLISLNIDRDGEEVRMAGHRLTQPLFDGKWFDGRPVALEGPESKAWRIAATATDGTKTETILPATCTYTPSGAVAVEMRLVDAAGIDDIFADREILEETYTDLAGIAVPRPEKGIFLKRTRYADGSSRVEKVVVK